MKFSVVSKKDGKRKTFYRLEDENGNMYFAKKYILDKENLKEIGLGSIELESDQYYIVNYDNLEILYTKGVQIGDTVLYKLSDFNKLNEEKDFVEENIKE